MSLGQAQRRAAVRDRPAHRPLPAELRRDEARAGRLTCPSTEPPDQRRDGDCRGHGHEHPAAQSQRDLHGAAQAPGQPRPQQRAALPIREGTGIPHRRSDTQFGRGAQGDVPDRLWIRPRARHVGARAGQPWDPDGVHHESAVHGEQGAAGRADCRHRAHAEIAAPARRQGSLDRRRANRAGARAGRRRQEGDVLLVQAHATAIQLRGQPDLLGPDGKSRGRSARATRPPFAPLALLALPARGRHEAARARARRAQEADPHPRGVRAGLRRPRRGRQAHPKIRGQTRLGGHDHAPVSPGCRADRRHPRIEDLPLGAAGDPGHS